jgi:branched-chain amino acid aminotransferase
MLDAGVNVHKERRRKMEVEKRLLSAEQRKPRPTDENALGFGNIFSDHILKVDYTPANGWHKARIEPYGPLILDPAAMVLHYGQEVFEGMKAYIGADGDICMFRPEQNFGRMLESAHRLCIPGFSVDDFVAATCELIRVDSAGIPKKEGTSLYVRPNIIAVDPHLGVRPSHNYLFYVMTGPVGAYYPEGFNPVKIYVEENYVRAAKGGLGQAKTLSNYASSLLAAEEAHEKGCTQVLWLDASDKQSIEEVGTMNIFFVIDHKIVTPPLNGSILPGVTRDSVLVLCRHWGLTVEERDITIGEVVKAEKAGNLNEMFGTGTAAVISPVGELVYRDREITINDGRTGPISARLYEELVGIQLGKKPDPFGWVTKL